MGVLLRRAENNFTIYTTTLGGKRSPLASLSAGRSEQVREGHSSHRKPQDRGGSRSLVGVARLFGQGIGQLAMGARRLRSHHGEQRKSPAGPRSGRRGASRPG